jgi:hypothetical protein
MARAEINREGVLNAIDEFNDLGRDAFLERYGFNGARDYFLIHHGRSYDSKAIAAVAHKWAPGGDGRALGALDLSGGREDAAKRLEALGFVVTTPSQNADWTWDEHVLALDLYMTNPASPPGKQSRQVLELSALLRRMGEQVGAEMTDKYRNANGVYMKMMNYRRLDPAFRAQCKSGLDQGSKGEEQVWRRFAGDRDSLRQAANAIKVRYSVTESAGAGYGAADDPVPGFAREYNRFTELVAANQKGLPFTSFAEGVVAAHEEYKLRLRQHALEILSPANWTESMIGSGAILDRTIAAVEIQEERTTLTNNLVFWQNRFGHASRDHRALLEARDSARSRRELELELELYRLYQSGDDESTTFERLSELTRAKYPLLAYLFFLRDSDRFLPIQPTGFDEAFRRLGIELTTIRSCSWDNYRRYNAAIGAVRDKLAAVRGLGPVRLIDAHSFCWLLVKLPSSVDAIRRARDAGRVAGARAKAIVNMRLSIEATVRNANRQQVSRTIKNKELLIDHREIEGLLERLLEIQGDRCALTGIPFRFDGEDPCLLPSADRIDSHGHYAEGNIQIVCRFINFWKSSSANDEFSRLLKLVQTEAYGAEGIDAESMTY